MIKSLAELSSISTGESFIPDSFEAQKQRDTQTSFAPRHLFQLAH